MYVRLFKTYYIFHDIAKQFQLLFDELPVKWSLCRFYYLAQMKIRVESQMKD